MLASTLEYCYLMACTVHPQQTLKRMLAKHYARERGVPYMVALTAATHQRLALKQLCTYAAFSLVFAVPLALACFTQHVPA